MIKIHWIDINVSQEITKTQRRQLLLERAIIICMLDPDTIYTPSAVAATAFPLGTRAYESAKRAFGGFSRRNGIALDFDNVEKKDSEDCGWYGSTWALKLPAVSRNKVAVVMDELRRLSEKQPGQYYFVNDELVHERDLTNTLKPSIPLPVLPVREGLTPVRNETGMAVLKPLRPAAQPPLGKFLSVIQPKKKKRHINIKQVLGAALIMAAVLMTGYGIYSYLDDQTNECMKDPEQSLNDG